MPCRRWSRGFQRCDRIAAPTWREDSSLGVRTAAVCSPGMPPEVAHAPSCGRTAPSSAASRPGTTRDELTRAGHDVTQRSMQSPTQFGPLTRACGSGRVPIGEPGLIEGLISCGCLSRGRRFGRRRGEPSHRCSCALASGRTGAAKGDPRGLGSWLVFLRREARVPATRRLRATAGRQSADSD